MEKKIRVGVLGCAAIARRSIVPALEAHDAFEVVRVASRDIGKARCFVEEVMPGAGSVLVGTYDDLVRAEDVDLVYCPLPTGLHYEWVKKCLGTGKHVLCEKSLACSYGQVRELVGFARENHAFLMESFQFRFHAQNLYVKELLRRSRIGKIRSIVVRFGIPPFPDGAANIRYSKALGGGALLDNGAYTIKAATYLLGEDVDVLGAMWDACRTDKDGIGDDVDLTGSIMMRSKSGVSVMTSYGFSHYYQNGYEIWGTKGKISTVRAFTARKGFEASVIVETSEGREELKFDDDHFARLLDHVAESLRGKAFEREYGECLVQAGLLQKARELMR